MNSSSMPYTWTKIFLSSVEMVGKIISRLLSCFTAFIKPSESQHLPKEIDVSKPYKNLTTRNSTVWEHSQMNIRKANLKKLFMHAQCLKNIYHLHDSNKLFFSNTYFNTKVTINKIFTVQVYNPCYTSQGAPKN